MHMTYELKYPKTITWIRLLKTKYLLRDFKTIFRFISHVAAASKEISVRPNRLALLYEIFLHHWYLRRQPVAASLWINAQ